MFFKRINTNLHIKKRHTWYWLMNRKIKQIKTFNSYKKRLKLLMKVMYVK